MSPSMRYRHPGTGPFLAGGDVDSPRGWRWAAGCASVAAVAFGAATWFAAVSGLARPGAGLTSLGLALTGSLAIGVSALPRLKSAQSLGLSWLGTLLFAHSFTVWAVAAPPPLHVASALAFGLAMAVLHTRSFAVGAPTLVAIWLPAAMVLAVALPGWEASLSLFGGAAAATALGWQRGRVRSAEDTSRRISSMLEVADRSATEGVRTARAALVHEVRRFLHELRNHQSAVRMNLVFLDEEGALEGEHQAALHDAVRCQREGDALITSTLASLRSGTEAHSDSFRVDAVVQAAAAEAEREDLIHVDTSVPPEPLVAAGNGRYLHDALSSLFRGSCSMGARVVRVNVAREPNRDSVVVELVDDAAELPSDGLAALQVPASSHMRLNGASVDLYRAHRDVELLGGLLEAVPLPGQGNAYRLLLRAASR